ncbi:uncharacterized oxidoreductase MexAM1_META1p0182-like isoform X2 [Haliotis rubra]|uniref:uncharacterized oxidoreductase MexAM1_META1p0182-like isoform X1 n=1 Tax=Haliotis rubra TaxID=36100 RepID=UPI001EE60780|nr:uncharacterized oxidoreductase MexAM1_META1p0182-like isoform X1 [Haliotis rubra]XP_046566618.1 uncharacterized oxidoreductase MexAM1_META1p0182-like isoform X2 [Haliotis rubra]
MESLRGKVTIVTGASSGIGAGIAKYLAKQGCRLSLTGRKQDNLEAVAKETGLGESDIITTVGDIAKPEDRQNLVDRTMAKYGRIDILVNNAGVLQVSPLSDVTEEHYDSIFNINLKAQVFLTKLAIPHLTETKGNIVNISSTGSCKPGAGEGVYSMSKIALDMYTKVLALELGPKGVRVNSVNPGFVPTDIFRRSNLDQMSGGYVPDEMTKELTAATPLRRPGSPEQIGQVVAFLASDMAAFVTGDILFADGGWRL